MKIKVKFVLTGSLLVFVILLISNYKIAAQRQSVSFISQTQDRVIIKKSDHDPPVKISKIQTRKGVVESGKSYRDDDDWLKGLTVTLNNGSGKSITHVNVEIWFRRPADQADKPPGVWDLSYGENPFKYATGEPIPPVSVRPIEDGETFEITLSDHEFQRIKEFLSDIKYPVLNQIELVVKVIGFSDGTVWTGVMMRRDPSSSFGWRIIDPPEREQSQVKQPQGSACNGTAVF